MSVCDSLSQDFQDSKLHNHFRLYTAHLAGRFQHWSLWQDPAVDLMNGCRVPWMAWKTGHCQDEVYCHLLQDPSTVWWYWQLELINARVFGCGTTCACLTAQCKSMGCHGLWRQWLGSTIWILGRVLFSLSWVEYPLLNCCHGRIYDLLSAGLNIAWNLGSCMPLWLWLHVATCIKRGEFVLWASTCQELCWWQVDCFQKGCPVTQEGKLAIGIFTAEMLYRALHCNHWVDQWYRFFSLVTNFPRFSLRYLCWQLNLKMYRPIGHKVFSWKSSPTLLSILFFWPHHWAQSVVGNAIFFAETHKILRTQLQTSITSDHFRYAMSAELCRQCFYHLAIKGGRVVKVHRL